jgi:putative methionine-R-sulfoxide reductase with GAF domain
MSTEIFSNVEAEAGRLAASASTPEQLMTAITQLLNQKMLKYNWVGFYMLTKAAQNPCWFWDHSSAA